MNKFCLCILLQLPIFIGLYSTFTSKEFTELATGNSSFLFIQDLTRSGMYSYDNIVLLVLFAATTFISQKLMISNPNDPMQKQMLYMMPIMITIMFVMVPVPSGAMLYVVISNIITVLQNLYVIKKRKAAEALGTDSIDSFAKKLEESDPKQKSMSSITLDKKSLLGDNQGDMSPALATASKSQRAKKKQKKNRKK
ncbi:MAG: YidC/Oxa1 family membrane protein insertase [Candidatus Sericytochromatia bacterium]